MKKTILVALMAVMIATPCIAQEIEPDGLFSIDNTRWDASFFLRICPIFPFPVYTPDPDEYHISFSDGKAYPLSMLEDRSFYVDLGIASIFMYRVLPYGYLVPGQIAFGILQPIGIGMMIEITQPIVPYLPTIIMMFLIKTDDNWTP